MGSKASSSCRPSPTSNSTSLKKGSTNANQSKTIDCNNEDESKVQKVDSVQQKKVSLQKHHVPKNLINGISNHHLEKSHSLPCNEKPDSSNHQDEEIENLYPITKDISESCQPPNVLNEPCTELAEDLGRKNVFNVLKNTTNTNVQSCKGNKENGKKIDTFNHLSKSKKQTLIYETVGESKQLKSAPKVKENLESTLMSEINHETNKEFKGTKKSATDSSITSKKRVYSRKNHTKLEPPKKTKAEKQIELWETLQSSHFEDIDDTNLSFL